MRRVDKKIEDMTLTEILRQQLELLAERSQDCLNEELPSLTKAMLEIYHVIV